jgi:hypothetical protein
MTNPVSAPRPVRFAVKAGAAPVEADWPSVSPEADRFAVSPATVRARAFQALGAVRTEGDPARLQAFDAEAQRLLAQPGLPAETQGVLHLLRCGAQGQLVLHGVDRRGNGKRSWQELHLAAQLAPGRIEVAQVYGRTILGMAKLGFFKRKIVTAFVGADLKQEARAADALLARFPQDPKSVLVRQQLAAVHHDKALAIAAETDVGLLEARDPQALRAARAELGGDQIKVASADATIQDL